MKRLLIVGLVLVSFSSFLWAPGANSPWGTAQIGVAITVNKGMAVSAWEIDDVAGGIERGSETGPGLGGSNLRWATLSAAGDGTYIVRVDLIPGVDYNYIFFSSAGVTIPNTGFSAGERMAEPIPAGGEPQQPDIDPAWFVSRSSLAAHAIAQMLPEAPTTYCGYRRIGGDTRRWIRLPTTIAAGTTVYVFHNFASYPLGVNFTEIIPSETSVEIRWRGGIGYWGSGQPTMDTIGGRYFIYVSTQFAPGPYSLLASLSGHTSYFFHTGLTPGTSYYYIFVASDSYRGPSCYWKGGGGSTYYEAGGTVRTMATPVDTYYKPWANLCRVAPDGLNVTGQDEEWNPAYPHYDRFGWPRHRIPVYFKVQDIDIEKLKHGDVVWMTPWEVDARVWLYKIPGTIIWTCTKPKPES